MDGVWPGLVVGPETVSQRIKLLRDSLGDDPKMPRYVAGVRGRGYRLLPAVVRRDPAGEGVGRGFRCGGGVRTTLATDPLAADAWNRRRSRLCGCSWIAVATGRPLKEPCPMRPCPRDSVAVLAFENRGGAPGDRHPRRGHSGDRAAPACAIPGT